MSDDGSAQSSAPEKQNMLMAGQATLLQGDRADVVLPFKDQRDQSIHSEDGNVAVCLSPLSCLFFLHPSCIATAPAVGA